MNHHWITAQLITARTDDAARAADSATRSGRHGPRRLTRSPSLRRLSL